MIGERLGTYAIDRELGSGGMGKVYAATGPDGTVAIKVVHPHLLDTPGFFKRFLREAEVGQAITHENVVRTLDCDAVSGHHFLVMEYVEGQTLADLQRELRSGDVQRTLERCPHGHAAPEFVVVVLGRPHPGGRLQLEGSVIEKAREADLRRTVVRLEHESMTG